MQNNFDSPFLELSTSFTSIVFTKCISYVSKFANSKEFMALNIDTHIHDLKCEVDTGEIFFVIPAEVN